MPELNHVDPDLKKYSDSLQLSIQVNLNGFSFCIYPDEGSKILAFRHYNFAQSEMQEDLLYNTREILNKDELLRFFFKNVDVIYTGRKSTLVPDEFFKSENLKSILEFNQPIDELDEIHFNSIQGCKSQLVFAIPNYFTSLVLDKFPGAVFLNQATPLLNYALSDREGSGKERVIVQLNKDFFDLIIMREGKLKLYNTFLYVSSTDLVYFILYACKQITINLKKTPLYFLGEYTTQKSLISESSLYLPSLELLDKTELFPRGYGSKKLDFNRFFTMLYLTL